MGLSLFQPSISCVCSPHLKYQARSRAIETALSTSEHAKLRQPKLAPALEFLAMPFSPYDISNRPV